MLPQTKLAHALDLPDELWLEILTIAQDGHPHFLRGKWLHNYPFFYFSSLAINRRLYPINKKAFASRLDILLESDVSSGRSSAIAVSASCTFVLKLLTKDPRITREVLPHVRQLHLTVALSPAASASETGKIQMHQALTSVHDSFPQLRYYKLVRASTNLAGLFDAPRAGRQLPGVLTSLQLEFGQESAPAFVSALGSMQALRRLSLWRVEIDGDLDGTSSRFTTNLVDIELEGINTSVMEALISNAPFLQVLRLPCVEDPQEIPVFRLLPPSLRSLLLGFANARGRLSPSHVDEAAVILGRNVLPAFEALRLTCAVKWQPSVQLNRAFENLISALPQMTRLNVEEDLARQKPPNTINILAILGNVLHPPAPLPSLQVVDFGHPWTKSEPISGMKQWPDTLTAALARRGLTNASGRPWTPESIRRAQSSVPSKGKQIDFLFLDQEYFEAQVIIGLHVCSHRSRGRQ